MFKNASSLFLIFLVFILSTFTQAQAEKVTYYYTDHNGSVLATTDAAGQLLSPQDYRPYGLAAISNQGDGPGFTGHVTDTDAAFVYMQARYYDPSVGRFLSVDPVTISPGSVFDFGRYGYASNNPVVNVDPDGRQTLPPSTYSIDWTRQDTRQAFAGYAVSLVPGYGVYNCATSGCGKIAWTVAVVSTGLTAAATVSKLAAPLKMAQQTSAVGFAEASGVLRDAAAGKGNFGVGMVSEQAANDIGAAWVGQGAKVSSNGKAIVSADSLRVYRPPSAKSGPLAVTGVQANLERYQVINGTKVQIGNAHLDISQ